MKKYLDEKLSAQERAEALVAEMTIEEAASQLRYDAPAIERLGIPAYNWWNEGVHGLARSGTATMFPQAIGLAAMFDTDLVRRAADITSTEARAKYNQYSKHGDRDIYKGLTLWAPNINIFRDPRWGRGHETYGEDPFLTAENGKAFVKGLQGEGKVLKTAACAKHFAVHSGPEAMRHSFDAKADPKDMTETYLYAFEALVKDAKVEAVMGAYNRVNGEPACASEFLMGKLKEWGFDGHFVSDCWAIKDFHENHMVTSSPVESAAMALKAGCDVNCGCTYVNLLAALEQGLITEDLIRRSCVKLMRARIRLGMFDKHTEYDDIPYSVVSSVTNKRMSLLCAEKSMVLLKNEGLLPLNEDMVRTIAVIGPNANSRAALEGNYCGTADRYVTFVEGIMDRFGGRVLYSEGCHLYKNRISGLAQPGDRYAEAEAAAENADVVVLCVGLDATIEGEEGDTGNEFSSGDKNGLLLPESQRILVDKIMKIGKPTIIVCAAGSAINTEADADAIIHTWYPGSEGGKALAQILFGDFSPSGKLPVTFYESTEKLPDFTDYSMKNRTYRYTTDNVLYPFGFGLNYGDVHVTKLEYRDGVAYVTAENNGDRTDEVIELYIKDYSENAVPNVSLCGFKRVLLDRCAEVTVEIPVPEIAFTAVDEFGARRVFGDRFKLYAGTHQPDELSCKLSGTPCLSIDITL
ncbi:MAG: glycoside hydrolase family 3 C-terminal domain-containing protein [Ruminococcus sp.]|nr:glycoside hydrolase family 3 C-terminal domain-containing protein [Ruminococcus sp.]